MLHAFSGDKFVRNLLNGGGFATHCKDLHAIVVVQVDVKRGDNHLVVVVLNVGKSGLDVLLVVVINQSDGSGDFVVGKALIMLDQARANQVGNGLRPVVVTLLFRHLVQLPGQWLGHGHGEPDHPVVLRFLHSTNGNKRAGKVNEVEVRSGERALWQEKDSGALT